MTFNEALTHLVERFRLYMWVQERIVPLEVKMVGVLVLPLGINYLAHQNGMTVNGIYAGMTWNCIGWQSILVLGVTLLTGLQGPYTKFSKLECLAIGILGTFLINILRISLVAILIVYINAIPATVAHDYFSAFILILWLFFFWWFSYAFVLETKAADRRG
ncbi:exosortase/archaeosortase family protein [Patescibacteria group bacterium]|nr:exosortase/archaeosortase family protein [Patescibacteria group bacterium]